VFGRHESRTVVLRGGGCELGNPAVVARRGAALLQAAKALDLLLVEEWTAGERVFVALRSMSGRL
jgi:hypothetical protein